MRTRVMLILYLALALGLLLAAASSVGSMASPVAGPPPAGTPPGLVQVRSTYPLDLTGQPAGQPMGTVQMHADSAGLPRPSGRPAVPPSDGSGWQRIEFQDFEGAFPVPPLWLSRANMADDGWAYFWDDRDCRSLSGSYSAWAIGFCNGGVPDCGASYANGVANQMMYGPFDLSEATDAEAQFALWADVEGDGAHWKDKFYWGASLDGAFHAGWATAGQTGDWVPGSLNLTNVPLLGDLTGQPEVYAVWGFESDESNPTTYEGAFVDDVALWVYTDPPPTPPPPTPTLPITRHTMLADFAGGRSHDGTVVGAQQGDGALTLAARAEALAAWERLPSLPRELFHFSAIVAKGHLFIIGGNSPDGGYQGRVYSAVLRDDGLLGHWIETVPLPQALQGHAAVVANDHVFVLGGFNASGIQATVFSAPIHPDGTLGPWTALPPLPKPLLYHAAVSTHCYIYVLGGGESVHPVVVSATVYRARANANGTLGDWETLPGLLPMRTQFHTAVAACDHLFLIGGADEMDERNHVYQTAVQADGSLGAWSHAVPLSKTLVAAAAAATHGGILVAGGWSSGDPISDAQRNVYWAPLGPGCSLGSWVERMPLPYSTHSHALAATDRYVYNLGGMNAAPRYFASVLMAPLQLGASHVGQGVFNHQFHLGDNYTIGALRWTEEGSGNAQVRLRYRVGDAGTGEYGPWSDYTSTSLIAINASGGFLEYQLRFEGGSGLGERYVTEVSIDIAAPRLVYLPLVVKD
jgi:hypothetical protein